MNLLTSRLYISVGYYLRIFAFYVQWLTVAGISQSSSNVARKIEFHKGVKVIRCCLDTPNKCGETHPHLLASMAQPFIIKFKLQSCIHSFHECFSWQTKSRIRDWKNDISVHYNDISALIKYVLSTMGVSKESISKFLIGNRFHVVLRILSPCSNRITNVILFEFYNSELMCPL